MITLTVERRNTSTVSDQTRGWLTSMLVHGLGIAASLLVVGAMEPPLPPSLFQWEISMMDSTTHTEAKPAEPVVQPPPPPFKPSPPVRQTRQQITEPPLPKTRQEITVPVETTQVVKDVVTNAEPVMGYAAVASTENEPVTSPSVVETAVESPEQPVIEERMAVEPVAPHTEHRPVEYRQVHYRETRADYGWLRDTLWSRIEELKRYPRMARENRWEGRVVVQAVIKADGTVGALSVAESSGHALLDEEALVVMRKASPLTMKHQWGKAQITILVPISYRLEG